MDFARELVGALPDLWCYIKSTRWPEPEDLLQATVLKAWQYRHQYEACEGKSLMAWLITIAKSQIWDQHRSAKRKPECQMDEATAENLAGSANPERQAQVREALSLLASVPAHHRRPLEMAGLGHDYAAIAEDMQITLGTTRSRLSRARDHFAALLERP